MTLFPVAQQSLTWSHPKFQPCTPSSQNWMSTARQHKRDAIHKLPEPHPLVVSFNQPITWDSNLNVLNKCEPVLLCTGLMQFPGNTYNFFWNSEPKFSWLHSGNNIITLWLRRFPGFTGAFIWWGVGVQLKGFKINSSSVCCLRQLYLYLLKPSQDEKAKCFLSHSPTMITFFISGSFKKKNILCLHI